LHNASGCEEQNKYAGILYIYMYIYASHAGIFWALSDLSLSGKRELEAVMLRSPLSELYIVARISQLVFRLVI
jgi:hypothetical protein